MESDERIVSNLAQTPLAPWHRQHGGRMVDFAGWEMPVQYSSIVEEHHATRKACGLFDVSHMGRLEFEGAGAAKFLDRLLTRRVAGMEKAKIRYSLVCNEQGGILDDVLIYCRDADPARQRFLMVVNASNREKIVGWIGEQLSSDDVAWKDVTTSTGMIAVQGPAALSIVEPVIDFEVSELGYYMLEEIAPATGHGSCLVSRTGYTGEDGCELIIPAEQTRAVWQSIMEQGEAQGIKAAGLGSRDTLRLEAAMPLYGHELSENIDPLQAGLKFAVNFKDRDFLGCEALRSKKAAADQPVRIGLELEGRRPAREHYSIHAGVSDSDPQIGEVTSGTFSPTLERPIAMGYVRPEHSDIGTELAVDVRGKRVPAKVVKLPFYSRSE